MIGSRDMYLSTESLLSGFIFLNFIVPKLLVGFSTLSSAQTGCQGIIEPILCTLLYKINLVRIDYLLNL